MKCNLEGESASPGCPAGGRDTITSSAEVRGSIVPRRQDFSGACVNCLQRIPAPFTTLHIFLDKIDYLGYNYSLVPMAGGALGGTGKLAASPMINDEAGRQIVLMALRL